MKLSEFDYIDKFVLAKRIKDFDEMFFEEYNPNIFTEEFFKSEKGNYYRYIKPLCIYLKTVEKYENIN